MTTYEKTGTVAAGGALAPPSATRVYLDTNLIIGLAKQDLPPTERTAMSDLLRRHKNRTLGLCTSHLAKEELTAYAQGADPTQDVIYMLLEDVPAIQEEFLGAPVIGSFALGSAGPIIRDELLDKLTDLLPHGEDARHVFQAARNGIDYFITCDHKSILAYVASVEPIAGIRLRSPSQLVADLASAES
jgi:hypothetical protein